MTEPYPVLDRFMGRKRTPEPRDRIDLRAEQALVARIRRQADRLGLSVSAYIRLAITERLEDDESTDPGVNGKRRR